MGKDYYFYTEARFKGVWYNIDPLIAGINGETIHSETCYARGCGIGILGNALNERIEFKNLAQGTRDIKVKKYYEDNQNPRDNLDMAESEKIVSDFFYYHIGSLTDLKKLAEQPKEYEYYVTMHQIEQFEKYDEDIEEYLTVHELLELPEHLRSNYILYQWDDIGNRTTLERLIGRVEDQLERFKDYIWYKKGAAREEYNDIEVRIICEFSF